MSVIEVAADPVVDVLERAALLLEEFGWCQGRAGSREEGELCMVSALYAALADGWSTDGICERLRAVGVPATPGGRELAEWNDVRGRTRVEVVAKLRAAANL